jgi:hypothetical protein
MNLLLSLQGIHTLGSIRLWSAHTQLVAYTLEQLVDKRKEGKKEGDGCAKKKYGSSISMCRRKVLAKTTIHA